MIHYTLKQRGRVARSSNQILLGTTTVVDDARLTSARSFRRVLRVLARITSGLGLSLASRNSTHSAGENICEQARQAAQLVLGSSWFMHTRAHARTTRDLRRAKLEEWNASSEDALSGTVQRRNSIEGLIKKASI